MAGLKHQNIRLDDAIARYVSRIESEGQAPSSVRTARYALRRFRLAVTTRGDSPMLHLITPERMDEYCFGPSGIRRGVAASSFNSYRSVLVSFFDYALRMRWTDVNVMDAIPAARPDAPRQHLYLNAGELLALLDHADNPVERVGMALGMNTGLRGNDVSHLTVFDASLAAGVIQTEIRKTNKLDVKPITMELHGELTRWLSFYADVTGVGDPGLLPDHWLLVPAYRNPAPSERDRRVKPRPTDVHKSPWRLVKRPLERMGYPTKGEGFHTLRRSSARSLFESLRESGEGRDHALLIVKEFLNHASVAQTEHYLGIKEERAIRDALLKDKPFLTTLAAREQRRVGSDLEVVQWRKRS